MKGRLLTSLTRTVLATLTSPVMLPVTGTGSDGVLTTITGLVGPTVSPPCPCVGRGTLRMNEPSRITNPLPASR
ncbi:MAG: hypothetical protein H0T63_00510 [Pyrinomonadaceae bacterium]|nr:hypothetical protein [Pyrinomonadaceae bacterium]